MNSFKCKQPQNLKVDHTLFYLLYGSLASQLNKVQHVLNTAAGKLVECGPLCSHITFMLSVNHRLPYNNTTNANLS